MLTEKEYKDICDAAEMQSLNGLWDYSIPDFREVEGFSFEERKLLFFWVFERLLNEGRIKLAKKGVFLSGTAKEQTELFRTAFPVNEEAMEDGIWFFDDECPGGAVWVMENGYLEWT